MSAQWKLRQALDALHAGYARLHEADPDMQLPPLPEAETAARDAVVAVARAAREATAFGKTARQMAQETAGRAQRFETRADQLRGLILAAMDALGEAKIEAPDLTVSLRKTPPAALVTDESAIPNEYWHTTRKLDREAVRDHLKHGVVIPGAELANGIPSVTIKGT